MLTAFMAMGVGCTTARYQAASLPTAMRVAPNSAPGRIHLPNLATTSAGARDLSPGDLLDVRVLSGLEEVTPEPQVLQVNRQGVIDVPMVGPVAVAGMEPPDASRAIAAAAIERGVYRRPNVTLEVRERATRQITVLGAVTEPGVHELPIAACDVLNAIAAAGGMTEEAGPEVEVMHQANPQLAAATPGGVVQAAATNEETQGGVVQTAAYAGLGETPATTPGGPVVETINLADSATHAAARQPLSDRDVVMVPPREKRVIHVTGLVLKPDQFELPLDQDIRVLDAIAMAGGLKSSVADKVFVIRQPTQANEEPAVIEVSISKAKRLGAENLILGAGDLVSVESNMATAMVDTVEKFFRVSLGLTSTAFTF
ncbi:MAG: SLBB domain-containing protein [Planctomycetota bacterium]